MPFANPTLHPDKPGVSRNGRFSPQCRGYIRQWADLGQGRKVTRQILERAIALKTEEPRRSMPHILHLMEQERGHPLDISPTALWRHLKRLGLSRRAKAPKKGLRRFEALRPGALWQCDVKHGPHLPDSAHPGL